MTCNIWHHTTISNATLKQNLLFNHGRPIISSRPSWYLFPLTISFSSTTATHTLTSHLMGDAKITVRINFLFLPFRYFTVFLLTNFSIKLLFSWIPTLLLTITVICFFCQLLLHAAGIRPYCPSLLPVNIDCCCHPLHVPKSPSY